MLSFCQLPLCYPSVTLLLSCGTLLLSYSYPSGTLYHPSVTLLLSYYTLLLPFCYPSVHYSSLLVQITASARRAMISTSDDERRRQLLVASSHVAVSIGQNIPRTEDGSHGDTETIKHTLLIVSSILNMGARGVRANSGEFAPSGPQVRTQPRIHYPA